MTHGRPAGAEVHVVTSAPPPHSQDLRQRMHRYLLSMAVRTLCVVLAVAVPGPARWVFVAGAVGLPYLAVLFANARHAGAPPKG